MHVENPPYSLLTPLRMNQLPVLLDGSNEQLNQCSKEIQKKCAFCASYHYPLFHGFRRNHLLYKFIFARIAQSRNS